MADESAQLERENQDSVEVSRNAAGGVSFRVKIYRQPGESIDQTRLLVQSQVDLLEKKYPAKVKE